jgi:hypothetical protein
MSDIQQDARYLKVTMMNGNVRRFAFETLGGDASTASSRLRELLEAQELILRTEDSLLIIPIANVQSLEIVPPPEIKIPHCLNILHEFED